MTILSNRTVNGTLAGINDIMIESLATTATRLLNTSMEFFDGADMLYGDLRGLLPAVDEARQAYELAQNQTQLISDLLMMLCHDVNELTRAVSMNHDVLSETLSRAQDTLDTLYMRHDYIASVITVLNINISNSESQLDGIQLVTQR